MSRLPAWRRLRLALAPLALLLIAAGSAQAAELADFFGTYVGTAEVRDLPAGGGEQRDMDIVIERYKSGGFKISWINVSLVDGRRDVPGVKRRVQSALFMPADGRRFYIESPGDNLFSERPDMLPIQGDPVRWAWLEGETLHVGAFVILEDGRYELHLYDRTLTETGLDIRFERVLDGQVVRRIEGRTVRAE